MTSILVSDEALTVRLPLVSRIAGVLGEQVVPRSAITGADVVTDGLAAARGLRAPGLAIPGRREIGTWRGRGARRFVDVRRGQPALRLRLRGQRYDELLIGHDDAAALVAQLAPSTGSPLPQKRSRG
ncbi:hypothetical protein [Blastococcus atacamensis]|uniref:hypothetical protein n=1 Tax=Blastococcus atacamensis TaxID=2070508 RepID=UPI000CEC0D5B|nr:hypothetical protein [Blastococcus atacamensis]